MSLGLVANEDPQSFLGASDLVEDIVSGIVSFDVLLQELLTIRDLVDEANCVLATTECRSKVHSVPIVGNQGQNQVNLFLGVWLAFVGSLGRARSLSE